MLKLTVLKMHITLKSHKADTVSITNSLFTASSRTSERSGSCEAIQLDILHDSAHFVGFEEFDDTPNKNVTISGCTFENLYSGIGTRSGVVSKYFDNIVIENNIFKNITEKQSAVLIIKTAKLSTILSVM